MTYFYNLCLFHLRIIILCLGAQAINTTSYHTVLVSDSTILDCCVEYGIYSKWKYEGVVVYFHNFFMNSRLVDNITILQNFSLMIGMVTLSHNGLYECHCNSAFVYIHYLEVKGMSLRPLRILIPVFSKRHQNSVSYRVIQSILSLICNAVVLY